MSVEKSKSIKLAYHWILLLIITGLVVLLNIIGSLIYTRIDMTEDQRYSLANGTEGYLGEVEKLDSRILLKIYLEGNLPAEVKRFRNAVEDKLKEFKVIAGDRLEYQFINPNEGSEAEKSALNEYLYDKGKGLIPLEIVYTKDGEQSQMLLWPGAVIEYAGATKNFIQLLPGTPSGNPSVMDANFTNSIQNSINNLEYMLVTSMKRATQDKKERIAFLHGHGELTYGETMRVRSLISPYYRVEDITLNDSIDALKGVKGLIIAAPKQPFTDKDKYIIDQFVMKGGRLMCFLDKLTFPMDSLYRKGVVHTTRLNTGLDKMLFDYGIKVNDNYVADVRCAPILIPSAKQNLLPWFFYVAASQTKHPISRNIEPVMLRYCSELEFVQSNKAVSSPVLTTSTNSTTSGLAPLISLGMPNNYGKVPILVPNPDDENNKKCIAGLVEGAFQSHFKNRLVDEFVRNKEVGYLDKSSREGKVFVVGNGNFIRNYYDSMPNKLGGMLYRPIRFNNLKFDETLAQFQTNGPMLIYGNQEFFQNTVDYMMGDNSVLDLRSKQIDVHPIDKEKVKADATYYKFVNMLIPSFLILLLALVIYYIRRKKYATTF